jgi:Mn2+/Fe2+ NRAMP family transporter
MASEQPAASPPDAPIPTTFLEYLRSFGPGFVVVLTWLGAGDVVDSATAGSKYGYALMWVLVLAVLLRFLFVSLIAKYQLCNQYREGVLDGLGRVHPWFPAVLAVVAVVMGHAYGSYMCVGTGEAWKNITGHGQTWQWAILWTVGAVLLVFRPVYHRVEQVFLVLLALLSVSLLGTAIWVGPSVGGIVEGTFAFELPAQSGSFSPLLVTGAILGAVLGSMMNFVYPYFLEQKGWRGPQYRRVQLYDFLLGIGVMIVLNLAVWSLAAELLFPHKGKLKMEVLTLTLGAVLGPKGKTLFYLGIFAAVYTSLIGQSLGLASLASHGFLRFRAGPGVALPDYRKHPVYQAVVLWCLVSPLIYTAPGMPDFVTLTLVVNAAQVMLVPFLVGSIWWITAKSRYIGVEYRNRWWENAMMAVLFPVFVWGAFNSALSVLRKIGWLG